VSFETDDRRYALGSRTPRERFNFLALAALLLSVFGIYAAWAAPIGLILSVVVLVIIGRLGGRGRGLAITGVVIGVATCLIYAAGLALGVKIS
jgi:hypothetical protein